jgi:hypothetical protein
MRQGPGFAHECLGELVVVQSGIEFSGAVPAEPVFSLFGHALQPIGARGQ